MMSSRLLPLLLSVGLLAGCGSNPSEAPLATLLLAKASTLGKPAPGPANPGVVTRAQVEATGIPLIRIRVPKRGLESYITRRDSNSGTESWATGDNTVITLRNGVLISTRALLPDLMSSSAPSVSQLATNGGIHARSYFLLGDNDSSQRLDFSCTMSSAGAEQLQVIERVYATVHMQETCNGDAGKIVNDYWIERGSYIRQSRQWTNPGIGHIEIAKLVE